MKIANFSSFRRRFFLKSLFKFSVVTIFINSVLIVFINSPYNYIISGVVSVISILIFASYILDKFKKFNKNASTVTQHIDIVINNLEHLPVNKLLNKARITREIEKEEIKKFINKLDISTRLNTIKLEISKDAMGNYDQQNNIYYLSEREMIYSNLNATEIIDSAVEASIIKANVKYALVGNNTDRIKVDNLQLYNLKFYLRLYVIKQVHINKETNEIYLYRVK